MNSFKAVYQALGFEANRQQRLAKEGIKITQETRGWVEEKGRTAAQRSKEYAHDYRYFPEPDLPPIVISRDWVERLRAKLPELPETRRDRFMAEYNLSYYDANLLTSSRAMGDYFETCLEACLNDGHSPDKRAKIVCNWLLGEFSRLINLTSTEIDTSMVSPKNLCKLIDLVEKDEISSVSAKVVFENMFNSGEDAEAIIAKMGLSQITNNREIEKVITEVLEANSQAVADYKAGKSQSITFLVGQVMRITRGRANPKIVNEILREKIQRG
jgi:aspartyl-tRNA(Asn)/glutamyl-tRNA(Gln) amidotransferase subunit B